jgi:YD repeat-containing protein
MYGCGMNTAGVQLSYSRWFAVLSLPIAVLIWPGGALAQQHDWHDKDKFLGRISTASITQGFQDRVEPFSGALHVNAVDITLPGKGGLDLVVQRYYSSAIWNRVEGGLLTKHAASSDPMDHLGGGGWQLHMGKVIQPLLPSDPWVAVMPDGSTHLLFNKMNGQGRVSRERWAFVWNSTTALYDLTLTDGTVYSFDPSFKYTNFHSQNVYQCTRIAKPGVTSSIQIQYSAASLLLTSITDTYGRTVTFSYVNQTSRIQSMTVSTGQTWTFAYSTSPIDSFLQENAQSRTVYALTSVQPPAGNSWTFAYGASTKSYGNGRYCLERVTLPTSAQIEYSYSPVSFNTGTQACNVQFSVVASRQVKDRDASVIGTWSYSYATPGADGAATTTTVKDAQNTSLLTDSTVFNGWGVYSYSDPNMWKVGLPQQRTVTTFAASGNQTEVQAYSWSQGEQLSVDLDQTTNWVGCGSYRTWQGVYFAKPSSVTSSTTRDGPTYTITQSSFDAYGNPGTVTEKVNTSQKRVTQLTYWTNPPLNILVGRVESRSASPGGPECYEHDDYGRRTRAIAYGTGASCSGGIETRYTYDETTGNLTSQYQPNGTVKYNQLNYLSYAYGQPSQIQDPNTSILFDRSINPSGTLAYETDGRGSSTTYRTTYTYDGLNRLKSIQPPVTGSQPTTFAYAADLSTVTVTRGPHSMIYHFDGLGRLTKRVDQQTTHEVRLTYNALGVRTQQQYYFGSTLVDTLTYDALGRLTRMAHAGDSSAATRSYGGTSGVGPTVVVTDEESKQTTLAYDAFGSPEDTRLTRVTDALGYQTSYQYHAQNGKLSQITAPLTQGNRSFTYNAKLLLASETHPESGTTQYQYDAIGNMTQSSRPGSTLTIGFDRASRPTSMVYSNGPSTTFAYDGAGQRTSMTSSEGTFTFEYDGNKNLKKKRSVISGSSGQITFDELLSYDNLDRLDVVTYPSGRKVKYSYDNRDWVTGASNPDGGQGYVTSISRHVNGAPNVTAYASGVSTTHGLDARYRLASITTKTPYNYDALSTTFTYDRVGNLKEWDDLLADTNDRTFAYDNLHRLNGASAPNLWGNVTFGYDALGNRTSRVQTWFGQSMSTAYSYASTNRLTSTTTGSAVESSNYDSRGNLASTVTTGSTHSISGRVTLDGSGLRGIKVTAGSKSTTTDANGNYTIAGLEKGWYKVLPGDKKPVYFFTPASQWVGLVNADATASFVAKKWWLVPIVTVESVAGSGAVTSDVGGIDCPSVACSATLNEGTPLQLSATPSPGWSFSSWGGACAGQANPCNLTVDSSKTVSATFAPRTGFYPLTPCRVFDTRSASGPTGGAPLAPWARVVVPVVGTCGVTAEAKALSANVTVVGSTTVGDLQVIPGDITSSSTSTISIPWSRARANNALIKIATDGSGTLSVINASSGTVHAILDVNGVFR